MGIVDEAIEHGVCVGRIADDLVPDRYRRLAGDYRRAAAVTLFEDYEQVVPRLGIERFELQSLRISNWTLPNLARIWRRGVWLSAMRACSGR
jgi:hypothetical protein